MKKISILSALVIAGCVMPSMTRPVSIITRTHLYDNLINESMTGLDPAAFFVVAQDTLVPSSAVKISVVPKQKRAISHRNACDEYYVDVNVSRIAEPDRVNVFLFHSDRVGNVGILRLIQDKENRYDFVEVPEKDVRDLKQKILLRISSRFTSIWQVPKRVLEFMRIYDWTDAPFLRK